MPDGSAGMGPAKAPAGPDPLVGEDRLRLAAGVVLLGTAAAGFQDLARLRLAGPGPAGLSTKVR
jgi:hypothetical protein